MSKRILLGITGRKNSGKSYFASKLSSFGFKEYQIAKYLKYIISLLIDCKIEDLESWEFKESPINNLTITPRDLLQKFGTEFCQPLLGKYLWIDKLISEIKKDNEPLVVISDVRFQHCVDRIKDEGGIVIRLEGGDYSDNHISEVGIDKLKNIDYSIEDKVQQDIFIPKLVNNILKLKY